MSYSDSFPTKGVTPEVKKEIIRKQKEFTAQQVSGMNSELIKLNKRFKKGDFTDDQYNNERQKIFLKYDITKEERIRFLGLKLGS